MDKTGVQIDAVLKQEDLGDRKRAFLKAGATETADGDVAVDPDTVLELFGSRGKTETLDPNDYTWEFSDYQPKTFTMTGEEASAFFNEMHLPSGGSRIRKSRWNRMAPSLPARRWTLPVC
jgi:hypothetical protein